MKTQNNNHIPTIYKLPVDINGLYADIDNCDPPLDVICVYDPKEPVKSGYTRYRLKDGSLADINLDDIIFAEWYELCELEIEKN